MDDCLFCKIVAGELPSTQVYEDDRVVAIMDIFPATRGHALVIPRAHAADVHEVADADLARPRRPPSTWRARPCAASAPPA